MWPNGFGKAFMKEIEDIYFMNAFPVASIFIPFKVSYEFLEGFVCVTTKL